MFDIGITTDLSLSLFLAIGYYYCHHESKDGSLGLLYLFYHIMGVNEDVREAERKRKRTVGC